MRYDVVYYNFYDTNGWNVPLARDGMDHRAMWMTWNVRGGPEEAEVEVRGMRALLPTLIGKLGMGCKIFDETGTPMWWGYVHEVEVHTGETAFSASMDDIANQTVIRFRDKVASAKETSGYDRQIVGSVDYRSYLRFGLKQAIEELGESNESDALQKAQAVLAERKDIQLKTLPESGEARGILRLRGIWQMLGWQIYQAVEGYLGNQEETGTAFSWFNSTSVQRVAQQFVYNLGTDVFDVWVRLKKVGNPTNNLSIRLRVDNGSNLPGVIIGQIDFPASEVSTADGWIKKSFPTHPNYGENGWLEVISYGTPNSSNYYQVKRAEAVQMPGWFLVFNGSSWVNPGGTGTLVMALWGKTETTRQIERVAGELVIPGTGTYWTENSGVYALEREDGKKTGLEKICEMLDMGTASGKKLDAYIDPQLRMILATRPDASTARLVIQPDGQVLYWNGKKPVGSDLPVGKWARILGAHGLYGTQQDAVFLTRAEWREGRIKVWWD